MKKFITLFLLVLIYQLKSQVSPGANCNLSTSFIPTVTPTSFEQTANEGWISFMANSANISLQLNNINNGSTSGRIIKASVYNGSCLVPNIIATDSITQNNDSIIILPLSGLVIGNVYNIKLDRTIFPAQCINYESCNENALFNILVAPLFCGISWGFIPPTPAGIIQNGAMDFNGFSAACFDWIQNPIPYQPVPATLAQCSLNTCFQTLYFGYAPACGSAPGDLIIQNYTLYVFSNQFPTYSIAVSNFTVAINFPISDQYTIVPNTGCNPQPPVSQTLTPLDLAGCGCTKLIVNATSQPTCNFNIPNPICANQSFCFSGINNQNPPYFTNWNILGFPGIIQQSGCVPNGLPSGTYQVSYNAFLYTPLGTVNSSCQCSKVQTFVVLPEPTPLSLQASVNETCTGGNVYLQVNFPPLPNTGYTWQPGNIIGNPILVNPMNSTTYTAYTSNGGCLFSGTIAVNVFTVPPTFSGSLSAEFVCIPNNSTTLTMVPAGTYTLIDPNNPNGIPFNTTIALNPNATSTYTIWGYNPGTSCLATYTIKANVVPCACLTAPGTTISGIVNTQVIPTYAKLIAVSDVTLQGGINYNPNNQFFFGLIGNEVNVYPGVKITVSPGAGVASGTVFLESCYFHGCGELWEGLKAPHVNQKIRIRSNIVTPNITTLIEDAKIGIEFQNIVPNQVYSNPDLILDADNVTFNKNIIGIKISNYQPNLVNYKYRIQSTLFTSRSLPLISNGNNPVSWPNTDAIRLSVNVGFNPVQTPYINNSLYPPTPIASNLYNYFGYPDEGIELRNVGLTIQPSGYTFRSIKIGQNGNNKFNCFDHLHTDIFAYNSNFSVINSVFQNGETFGAKKGNQIGGAAIVAYSDLSSTGTNRNSLQVNSGGGNGNFNCRFYEKTGCVDATDYFDIQISDVQAYSLGNNYNQFYLGNTFGERGFNITTNRYQNIVFQRNKLYNIKNAMMIGINNLYSGPNILREIGQILVQNNTVDRSPTLATYGAAPYVNIGLSISDPAAATSLTVQGSLGAGVLTNYFNRVNNGISVMNLNPTPLGVLTNTVNLANEYPFFPVPTPTQVGISVRNCKKQVSIHSNRINGPNAVIGIPSWSSEMRALTTAFNSSLSVRCNTTQNTERGVEFNGTQTMDYFEDNWMSNESYGLVLDNSAILTSPLNGTTSLGNPQRPTNNVWSHPWPVPGGYKTLTTGGSSAQNAKLYVTWGPGNVDPDDSRFSTTQMVNPFPVYFHGGLTGQVTLPQSNLIQPPPIGCRISGGNGNGGGGNQNLSIGVLEQIAGPGYSYPNNQAQHNAINRTFAYQTLVSDPALVAASPSITSFYNSAQFTSLQTMVDIEQNLVSGNIGTAQSLISAFTPTNSVELNYKSFYQIFKNVKDSDIVTNDSIALFNLANMCPYIDGAVVYQARALYNIIFTGYHRFVDNCGPVQNAKIAPSSNNPEKLAAEPAINVIFKTALYPNPNNGVFVLKLHDDLDVQKLDIEVFDITGKLVLTENSTDTKEAKFDLSNKLLNGTYMVKVKLQDGSFDIHRLIISK